MRRSRSLVPFLAIVIASVFALSGCAKVEEGSSPVAANKASSDSGKIPVTTSSEEARKEFLQGRDLSEKIGRAHV